MHESEDMQNGEHVVSITVKKGAILVMNECVNNYLILLHIYLSFFPPTT